MAEPFLSEIRIFSFNFPPKGWAFANGQLLPINQNQALFSLLGTTYGGNGQIDFQLPNLQGKVPLYVGIGFTLGSTAGEVNHTLITSEIPAHTHTLQAAAAVGTTGTPTGATAAQPVDQVGDVYGPAAGAVTGPTTMAPQAISNAGGNLPHNNMQPYLVLNFCIALQGIFPSQT